MNTNIKLLLSACKSLGISTRAVHSSGNLIQLENGMIFLNWSTPCNCQSAARLCTDKDYTYSVLHSLIKMPETIAYLSPYIAESFKKYLRHETEEAIVVDINKNFDFPLIVKCNQGSHGTNVYLVKNQNELVVAVTKVLNIQDKDYDYILLAQEFCGDVQEYRVIWYKGEVCFAYLKSKDNSVFEGNLSPLHWQGARAVKVVEKSQLAKFEEFLRPLSAISGLNFCGVDVLQDRNGGLVLLELNSSPGFDYFVRDNGEEDVVALYVKILEDIV